MSRRALGLVVALAGGLLLPAPVAGQPPTPWLPHERMAYVEFAAETVKTATLFNITFYEDNTGDPGLHEYHHGDGTGSSWTRPGNLCIPFATRQLRFSEHAYRRPGTYTVRMKFTSACEPVGFPKTVEAMRTIKVLPGPMPGNGPRKPYASVYHRMVDGNLVAHVTGAFSDDDGYVSKIVYSWGDKSKDTVFTLPLTKCRETKATWPRTTNDDIPKAMKEPTHKYASRGQYTVTLTAYSTGCNGKDTQTAKASWRFTV